MMVTRLLALLMLLTSCRTPNAEDSTTKSLAVVPVTLVIAETIVQELVKLSLKAQWDKIQERHLRSQHRIGDVSDADLQDTAEKISMQADPEFQRQLKVKLNSLQDTLGRDYVAGSPDSIQLLALMIDKANDIRNSIEIDTRGDLTKQGLTNALASYQSYLLVSSLGLAILMERARAAEASGTVGADVVQRLKRSVWTAAEENARHIQRLNGPIFEAYAKAHLFQYEMQSKPGVVDFGFEGSVRYAYCVADQAGSEHCGAPSRTVCASEFEQACVTKAQDEAKAALTAAGHELRLLDAARQKFFAIDLAAFAESMLSKAQVMRQS
jgi:hypothetical protein